MKRVLIQLLVFIFPVWASFAQTDQILHPELPATTPSDIILHHTGYTLRYDSSFHLARWVAYELTAEETVPIAERNNRFVPDPFLPSGSASNADYDKSGYDKGHLAPSADMCYSSLTMQESFYLSNMSPQDPGFNRGIWKQLEEQVRNWAVGEKKVYVVTGPVLSKGLASIGDNQITIPRYFYKVILDYTQPVLKGIGFIMPNERSALPLKYFAVSIDSVEMVTGLDFFYQLPDEQEKVIESKADPDKWNWKTSRVKQKKTIQPSGNEKATVVRCSAITKKGTRCLRTTSSPNGRCSQHGGK
ncbi:MAG TPA: DNA/RNA non-specific endonuclease [Bacteroidales bacterium]|nr:DNA/RNA non-specific endonuclease [Bacteroidales bacterium]